MGAQIQLGCKIQFLGLPRRLVEGEQTPVRGLAIEVGETHLHRLGAAFGNEQRQRPDVRFSRKMFAAVVEP